MHFIQKPAWLKIVLFVPTHWAFDFENLHSTVCKGFPFAKMTGLTTTARLLIAHSVIEQ